jgi:hypothetical protein
LLKWYDIAGLLVINSKVIYGEPISSFSFCYRTEQANQEVGQEKDQSRQLFSIASSDSEPLTTEDDDL